MDRNDWLESIFHEINKTLEPRVRKALEKSDNPIKFMMSWDNMKINPDEKDRAIQRLDWLRRLI